MNRRILVILGHPSEKSFCGALAESYLEGAREAGHETRLLALNRLRFDPILRQGYTAGQELEPDLLEAQESVRWAQHLVFVYPLWWGGMPALLKGFFERVFLPGFAFRYREGSPFWDRLLVGRSAHVLVTMDTPPWFLRWVYHRTGHRQIQRDILGFSGIKPVRISDFGPMRGASRRSRERWLGEARTYGREA